MYVVHHDLHHEFPELSDAIHQLKTHDHHFAKLFGEYHQITSQIETLEGNNVPVTDEAYEALKKQRLTLKDKLYAMLVKNSG
ncbi:MAG: YdcH family protein [Rhodocyclaceae bacterium]|nr:YdcH family protein [Rhodocyclaceae bacterium]